MLHVMYGASCVSMYRLYMNCAAIILLCIIPYYMHCIRVLLLATATQSTAICVNLVKLFKVPLNLDLVEISQTSNWKNTCQTYFFRVTVN